MIGSLLVMYVAVLVVMFLSLSDGSSPILEESLVLTPSPWDMVGREACCACVDTWLCLKSWFGGVFAGKKEEESWIWC